MKNLQELSTDYLIVGSGVAGLTLALKLAESFADRRILIVTKAQADESNTKYAQGGIAVVLDPETDTLRRHMDDTLSAGGGLCNEKVVAHVVERGPAMLQELVTRGACFDLNAKGSLDLAREGGHSTHRIVHTKDMTGFEIESTLLRAVAALPNIRVLTHCIALDLITGCSDERREAGQTRCYGTYVLDQQRGSVRALKAGITILATGGIGRLYGHTTNPPIATGDGIAMASRAGVKTSHMEFVQFHPTAHYDAEGGRAFLISEAVRGFGALLRNAKGERFMPRYDPRAELASRDKVSQSIYQEMVRSGHPFVFLDGRHLDSASFRSHFPNISAYFDVQGLQLSTDLIPVVPAAHYLCGGVDVNMNGQTSMAGLYACGECAHTGLHGANRLASNSLLEALVYADQIWRDLKGQPLPDRPKTIPAWRSLGKDSIPVKFVNQYQKRLQEIMRRDAGIVRSSAGLLRAQNELEIIAAEVYDLVAQSRPDPNLYELRNMVECALLIIDQSIGRRENIGGFCNCDFEMVQEYQHVNK